MNFVYCYVTKERQLKGCIQYHILYVYKIHVNQPPLRGAGLHLTRYSFVARNSTVRVEDLHLMYSTIKIASYVSYLPRHRH